MTLRFVLRDIALNERPVAFEHPFRFGAITVNGAPEAIIHAEIEARGRTPLRGRDRRADGAEMVQQGSGVVGGGNHRAIALFASFRARALSRASVRYRLRAARACHDRQIARCARADIPALAAAYGPAELDKAILDALLRALGLDIFSGLKQNVAGLDARLTPDIDNAIIGQFLNSREPTSRILVRHTVGMLDPLEDLAAINADSGCPLFQDQAVGRSLRRSRPAGQDHPGAHGSAHRLPADAGRQRAIYLACGAGDVDRRAP
jgi:hypothetical protein